MKLIHFFVHDQYQARVPFLSLHCFLFVWLPLIIMYVRFDMPNSNSQNAFNEMNKHRDKVMNWKITFVQFANTHNVKMLANEKWQQTTTFGGQTLPLLSGNLNSRKSDSNLDWATEIFTFGSLFFVCRGCYGDGK